MIKNAIDFEKHIRNDLKEDFPEEVINRMFELAKEQGVAWRNGEDFLSVFGVMFLCFKLGQIDALNYSLERVNNV